MSHHDRGDEAMTFKEIAQVLGWKEKTVWMTFHRGLRKLRSRPHKLARLQELVIAAAAERAKRNPPMLDAEDLE